MKHTLSILAGLLTLAGACTCAAQREAPSKQKGPLPIIPGAAGFGINTPAGSGRHLDPPRTTVYKVTNLNTGGPGSLTAGLEAEGPRVIVFEVSGNIDIRPYRALAIKNPHLTVAGQTAPSPGITLVGCELHVNAHDVLLQHIRVRVGDLTDPTRPEVDPKSGWSQELAGTVPDLHRRRSLHKISRGVAEKERISRRGLAVRATGAGPPGGSPVGELPPSWSAAFGAVILILDLRLIYRGRCAPGSFAFTYRRGLHAPFGAFSIEDPCHPNSFDHASPGRCIKVM